MAEAEPVIRAVLPDANVPTSIRSTGVPVVHGPASELGRSSTPGWPSTPTGSPASSLSATSTRTRCRDPGPVA